MTKAPGFRSSFIRADGRRGKPRIEVDDDRRWRCDTTSKWAYVTRRAARKAAKAAHPDDTQLSAYRCRDDDHWHIGHATPYSRDSRRTA
jgi:hypothetical protein